MPRFLDSRSLPFDSAARGVTGDATPLTPANIRAGSFDLAADGSSLVYASSRPGASGMHLWRVPIPGEPTLLREGIAYFAVRLSRNGERVAYRNGVKDTNTLSLAWSTVGGTDEHIFSTNSQATDWSLDGRTLLGNCGPPPPAAVCKWTVDDATPERVRFFADPSYHIWQSRYSPDGRWILFHAQDVKQSSVSILGVVPAAGGAWRRLTDAGLWADKARSAPDGKTIYFIFESRQRIFRRVGDRIRSGEGNGYRRRVPRDTLHGSGAPSAGSGEL